MDDFPCSVRMTLRFDTAEQARRVARALEPDNEGFVRTTLKGRSICTDTDAKSIPALLHTLDDFLACLSVAARMDSNEKPNEE